MSINPQALDNYITGHYGEDQYRDTFDAWVQVLVDKQDEATRAIAEALANAMPAAISRTWPKQIDRLVCHAISDQLSDLMDSDIEAYASLLRDLNLITAEESDPESWQEARDTAARDADADRKYAELRDRKDD